MNITNKRITIIGCKKSGMALARLAGRLKGKVKISEQGTKEEQFFQDFKQWARQNDVKLEFGGHTKTFIEDSDLIILSPGVHPDAIPLQWAKAKKIPVLGEIEFAFQFCPKPVIALTGSNGKTTTSTLIHEVLKEAGCRSRLCGNIGYPFSDGILDLQDQDFVVLEVSSFQMEVLLEREERERIKKRDPDLSMVGFRPKIAVMLNFSENHLDRHKDIKEYWEAKKKIFLNQEAADFAVVNAGSHPYLKELPASIKSKVIFFDKTKDNSVSKIKNPNYLAVEEVAKILGISALICRKVFDHFKGVEHRLEWVRHIDGVDFINDSKATTAEAARWALANIDKPVVMICGGRDKNIDFSVLSDIVKMKVKKMIVIGEAREKIKRIFQDIVYIEECDRLEKAVLKARESASQGDCILLSPMCASFDMFKNFEERGKVFKEIVNSLR